MDYDVIVIGPAQPARSRPGAGRRRAARRDRRARAGRGECSYFACIPSKPCCGPARPSRRRATCPARARPCRGRSTSARPSPGATSWSPAGRLRPGGVARRQGHRPGPRQRPPRGPRRRRRRRAAADAEHVVIATGCDPLVPPLPASRGSRACGRTGRRRLSPRSPGACSSSAAARSASSSPRRSGDSGRRSPSWRARRTCSRGNPRRSGRARRGAGGRGGRAAPRPPRVLRRARGRRVRPALRRRRRAARRPDAAGHGQAPPHGRDRAGDGRHRGRAARDRGGRAVRAGENVWAIGDVAGIWPLTYVGKYQGRIAAANILGTPREASSTPCRAWCSPTPRWRRSARRTAR